MHEKIFYSSFSTRLTSPKNSLQIPHFPPVASVKEEASYNEEQLGDNVLEFLLDRQNGRSDVLP